MASHTEGPTKKVDWIGSSKGDLVKFPRSVVKAIGTALLIAQYGGTSPSAKAFRVKGGGVMEVVEDFATNTYRAVYTVRFEDRIYVLHCFQKKSKKGIKTPKQDVDLIKSRLKHAQADYNKRHGRR